MPQDTSVTELTIDRVRELQREGRPRLRWTDLLTVTAASADEASALDAYFRRFAAPSHGECLNCGTTQSGMFGAFQWGIAHGEGRCSTCGYPARAHHYDVGPIKRLQNVILQYHPDELRPNEAEGAAQ